MRHSGDGRTLGQAWRAEIHRHRTRLSSALLLSGLLLALALTASALADEPAAPGPVLTPQLIEQASSSPEAMSLEAPPTDPQAAKQLPNNELGRGEALELLTSVFGAEIETPAGLLDEMPPAHFLTDHAAVMPADAVAAAFADGEGPSSNAPSEPVLIESSVPLRTKDEEGRDAPVDLSLEHSEGELQPSNPIVEAGIPVELGEGISLANGDVKLSFPDASGERSASTVEGDAAFYPNVQEDSDLLVAPVPGGVETMTQVRTPQAPRTQTVHVSLPEGAELKETEAGGVEASLNGRTLMSVASPTALDAAGDPVPMSMAVSGGNIELTVSPDEETSFPILADPVWTIENYNWTWGGSSFAGWKPVSYVPSYQPLTYQSGTGIPALDLTSGYPGAATPNTGAQWQFLVPRYDSDMAKYGTPPQSFISAVFTEGMMFQLEGNHATWPELIAGIIDTEKGEWTSVTSWNGTQGEIGGWSGHANFYNFYEPAAGHTNEDTHARTFVYGLITLENEAQAKYRQAIAAKATTSVADHNTPVVQTAIAPAEWVNTGEAALTYAASDAGLGVQDLEVVPPGGHLNGFGQGSSPEFLVGCTGVAANSCPREVSSEIAGSPKVTINAATAPEGVDNYTLAALDPLYSSGFSEGPVSHVAEEHFQLWVDHTAPALSLSGSLTEQSSLGTAMPQYTLKYNASDGTEGAPTYLTPYGTEGAGNAQFKHPADISRDGAGNMWVADENNNRIEKLNEKGEFLAAYSALGTSDQLNKPTGIEVDAAGDVWVADTGNNRMVEFNSKGEWVRKVGHLGSGNGEFSAPQGIAIDPNGDVWVADTANNRVQELSSTGTFIRAFGSKGSGNGQLSEPTSLDVGPGGKVWVADAANNRLEEFTEAGGFLAAYGTLGSGNGQLNHPDAIEVDSRGSVWVADQNNGRVEQFSERGEYLGSFGAKGTGPGQFSFSNPTGLTTNKAGSLWVADSGDNRIERWNAPQGTRSGAHKVVLKMDGKVIQEPSVTCPQGGCPLAGEWTLHSGEYSAGTHTVEVIATDGVGLATTQKLTITLSPPAPALSLSGTMTEQATLGTTRPRYKLKLNASAEEGTGVASSAPPTYSSAFGSAGTGQLSYPGDVAVDAKGNSWVVDQGNNRVEEFNEKGEYVAKLGSSGSGNGQLSYPTAVAIAPKGEIWVTDAGNNRLEEFTEGGEFVKAVGTYGNANGQFASPEGIAIDSTGAIYVSDTLNGRIEKLNEKGEFVKIIGTKGSGAGQLLEPCGIDIGPGGNIWVADYHNNKVVEFNETFGYVRQFGTEGTGNGQFVHPFALAIDNSGTVWVGDEGNGRVEGFNQSGQYVTQFGSKGTGTGQFRFGYPMGIATDAKANLLITDTNNNRVQKWSQASRSQVKTEVTVDGKKVDSGEGACTAETCPFSREWWLESSAYAVGKHTVVAKATDGYGQTTSKTLTIEVQRDTTKPTIQTSGELASAPSGWVQQESYGLNASATDAGGYGATSLTFKIDGATVASTSKACPDGACEAAISKSVSMAAYPGGAHEAEVIATDGAGNTATKRWTINVDPEGHVSTAEATATLEAAEETSVNNLVGDSEEEPISGTMPGLGLEATETGFAATGSAAPMTIADNPGGPMTVEIPEAAELYGCTESVSEETNTEEEPSEEPAEEPSEGSSEEPCIAISSEQSGELQPVVVTPLGVNEGASASLLVEENASVSADTDASTDTVVRPLNDGGMIFQAIRNANAPETYAYRITLGANQELRQVDDTHVEVYYSNGYPAFAIAAEAASDAIGTAVPTTLEVTGEDVVTLTVHHRAGSANGPFVYPVVSGTGWEGGFHTEEVHLEVSGSGLEASEDSDSFWSQQVPDGSWAVAEGGGGIAGPPEFEPQASASSVVVPPSRASRTFSAAACWHFPFGGPSPPPHPNPHAGICQQTSNLAARGWVHGRFHWETSPNQHVWWDGGREGEINCTVDYLHNAEWGMWPKQCHFAGENQQPGHIVARNFWRVETYNGVQNGFGYEVICLPMYFDLFSNGNVQKENQFYEHGNAIGFVGHGEGCPWPQ